MNNTKKSVRTHDGEYRQHRNKRQKRRSSKLTRTAVKRAIARAY